MSSPALTKAMKIADPIERLRQISDINREAVKAAEHARQRRDVATTVAHLDQGASQVHLYRDVLDISRALFVRIIQRAPAQRPAIDDAVEVARAASAEVHKHEAIETASREVRDPLILDLLNGDAVDAKGEQMAPVSNAEVARITGLTTARIAQMRGELTKVG